VGRAAARDDPCLTDIIDIADRVDGQNLGMDQSSSARIGLVWDAPEWCVERICEAAFLLGAEAEELVPDQPWGDIRGMGNCRAMRRTASAWRLFG